MSEYIEVIPDSLQELWARAVQDPSIVWYIGVTTQGLNEGYSPEKAVKTRGYNHSTTEQMGVEPHQIYHTGWIQGEAVNMMEAAMVNDYLDHPRGLNKVAAGNAVSSEYGIVYLRIWHTDNVPQISMDDNSLPPIYPTAQADPFTGMMEIQTCKHLGCSIITACLWLPCWIAACCGSSSCEDPCPNTCLDGCNYGCCSIFNCHREMAC